MPNPRKAQRCRSWSCLARHEYVRCSYQWLSSIHSREQLAFQVAPPRSDWYNHEHSWFHLKKGCWWMMTRMWSILYRRENVRWFWHICLHLVQHNVSNASRSSRLWHRNRVDCCDIHNSPDRTHSNNRKVVVLRVELKAREESFSFSPWSTKSALLFPTKIAKRSNRQIVELPMMINELYKLKVKKETKKEKKKWERYNNQVKQRYSRR